MRHLIDISGQTFGTLCVISRAANSARSRNVRWNVRCVKCGHESVVAGVSLRSGVINGTNCIGCKPRTSGDAPLSFNVDDSFVRSWSGMVCAATARVLGGYCPTYFELRDDILSDTFVALAKHRGAVHENAVGTFIFNTARLKAIDHLDRLVKTRTRTPNVVASDIPDAANNYDLILESLTDGAEEFEVSERTALCQQIIADELTTEEQDFARQYVATPTAADPASRTRMWRIRTRLRERLTRLPQQNPSAGVQ